MWLSGASVKTETSSTLRRSTLLSLRIRTVALSVNSTVIYVGVYLDLGRDGPVVLDMPPILPGILEDLWQVPVSDIGLVWPDKGKGRK